MGVVKYILEEALQNVNQDIDDKINQIIVYKKSIDILNKSITKLKEDKEEILRQLDTNATLE